MKRLVWVAGFVIGLPLVWIGVSGWLSARQERANAGRAWKSSGLTVEQAALRFPKTVTSPAALQIEAAAKPMGIAFAYHRPPDTPEEKAFKKLDLGPFVDRAISTGDDVVAPPSPEIVAFLASHAREIAAIRSAAARDLEWATDVAAGLGARTPNMRGLRAVQNLLAADALHRLSKRDVKGALESIEAGWRINDAFRRRPEQISQIIAMMIDGHLLGMLRKVPRPAPDWIPRVARHDYRDSTVTALQVETWQLGESARGAAGAPSLLPRRGPGPPGPGATLRAPLERSLVRLWAARHARLMWKLDEQIHTLGPCALDKTGSDSLTAPYASRWNLHTASVVKSYVRTAQQAVRRSLDAELTRMILESGALRGSGTLPSSVCSGVSWQYRVTPHEISLAIDHDPLGGTSVRDLPFTFTGRR